MSDGQLIELYRQMAEMTKPKCDDCQRAESQPETRCCDAMYCKMAVKVAREAWDLVLETTDHPKLPLMGPEGCVAPPHVRPLCTVHTCDIQSLLRPEGS